MRHLAPLICAALALSAASGLAQTADELKSAFAQETRRLDEAIEEYARTRALERSAVNELSRLSQQLDSGLEDPNSSLAYLTRLESEVAVARATACSRLEQTSAARKRIYERMELLGAVARDFEEQADLFGISVEGITGMWQIEAQPIDVYGLLNLRLTGSQVSGPYRLSNGRRGSIRGALAGSKLELEMIDAERGVVANIEAELEPGGDRMQGTWLAMELASGQPSRGEWLAERVSSREEVELD